MNEQFDNYQAWSISLQDFPKDENIQSQIKFICRFGILAASIHNTQPWVFEIEKDILKISPNWNLYLPHADPDKSGLFISLGCCLTNIESAAAYYGFGATTQIISDPQDKAHAIVRFSTKSKPDRNLRELCPFIPKRYSNKSRYLDKLIPKKDLQTLMDIAVGSINIKISDDKSVIESVAKLHEQAETELVYDKGFAQELSFWLRPNNSKAYDGMPGFVSGLGQAQSLVGKLLIGKFSQLIRLLAKKDHSLIKNSPATGTVLAKGKDIATSINTGRAYQRLALIATSLGLRCTPHYAMIISKECNPRLGKIFALKGERPQFFFRIGYSDHEGYRTPRRKIEDFFEAETSEKQLADSMGIDYQIKQVKIGKYTINYLVAGKGKPLLLLHGGNIGWGQWYPNIPEFTKHFKVYAIDLPGCGFSSSFNSSNWDFEKDFVEIIEKFVQNKNLQGLRIIAHSFSGAIALKLAIRKKISVKKLVLMNPMGFSDHIPSQQKMVGVLFLVKLISKTALYPTKANMTKFLTSVMVNKTRVTPEFINYFFDTINDKRTTHPLIFINGMTNGFKIRSELVLRHEFDKINIPVFVIFGEKDQTIQDVLKHRYYKEIPNIRFELFPNTGHVPSIEKSGEFNKKVAIFLKLK